MPKIQRVELKAFLENKIWKTVPQLCENSTVLMPKQDLDRMRKEIE